MRTAEGKTRGWDAGSPSVAGVWLAAWPLACLPPPPPASQSRNLVPSSSIPTLPSPSPACSLGVWHQNDCTTVTPRALAARADYLPALEGNRRKLNAAWIAGREAAGWTEAGCDILWPGWHLPATIVVTPCGTYLCFEIAFCSMARLLASVGSPCRWRWDQPGQGYRGPTTEDLGLNTLKGKLMTGLGVAFCLYIVFPYSLQLCCWYGFGLSPVSSSSASFSILYFKLQKDFSHVGIYAKLEHIYIFLCTCTRIESNIILKCIFQTNDGWMDAQTVGHEGQ